jgi:hypothetical protein
MKERNEIGRKLVLITDIEQSVQFNRKAVIATM